MNCSKPQKFPRSLRLTEYDYTSPGAYFVTLISWNRDNLFGSMETGEIVLSQFGEILREEWEKSPTLRAEIQIDVYAILPDHFHAIFWIIPIAGVNDSTHPIEAPSGRNGPKPKSVGALMAGFKAATTKRINTVRNSPGLPVWQPNYYEHVIRNEVDLTRIREYILRNPERLDLS